MAADFLLHMDTASRWPNQSMAKAVATIHGELSLSYLGLGLLVTAILIEQLRGWQNKRNGKNESGGTEKSQTSAQERLGKRGIIAQWVAPLP